MQMKRALVELALWCIAHRSKKSQQPASPESIFILRNNDIGDLLVVTPLFEALKRRFPETKVCAGIGSWNLDVLKQNPWVDEVHIVNAPWHNKQSARHPSNTIAGWRDSIRYIYSSGEMGALRQRRLSIGIDVLGSVQGSLLMLRAGIPYRLGVRGYAGGYSACHRFVDYSELEHVGQNALRFATLLGASDVPPNRPQLYLSRQEKENAEKFWAECTGGKRSRRVVLAPGGGFREKCWPIQNFVALARELDRNGNVISVIGGPADKPLGADIVSAAPYAVNWTGKASLRETFALISAADLVICNSSMAMHAAAAFCKKTIVVLGEWYADAEQHARQWGYSADFHIVGRRRGHPDIPSAEEIIRSAVPGHHCA
jgi:ADP-heptose:LPS heptosyltransferase